MDNKEKQLQRLVRHEAKALRRNATEQEKGKLNAAKLIVDSRMSCIYGQMTGNCDSPRAIELIEKCASRVLENPNPYEYRPSISTLNGTPRGKARARYFSPIEVFIYNNQGIKSRNKDLIDYIKGETNELNFE